MNRRSFMSAAALSPISIFATSTAPASEVESDDRIVVQVTNADGRTKEFVLLHEGHVEDLNVHKATKFRKLVAGQWSGWHLMKESVRFNDVRHMGRGQVTFWGYDIPAGSTLYSRRPVVALLPVMHA